MANKFCGKCGAPLNNDESFCPACGAPVRASTPPPVQTVYTPPVQSVPTQPSVPSYTPPAQSVPAQPSVPFYAPPVQSIPTQPSTTSYAPPVQSIPTQPSATSYAPPVQSVPTQPSVPSYAPPVQSIPTQPSATSYAPPVQSVPPRPASYAPPVQNTPAPPNRAYYAPPANAAATPPNQPYYAPPAPPAQNVPNAYAYGDQYPPAPSAKRKNPSGSKTGLLIAGIITGVVLLIVVAVIGLTGGFTRDAGTDPSQQGGQSTATLSDADLPQVTYSYLTRTKEVNMDFTSSDTIYPNLYNAMDSIVNLTATSEGGATEAIVKVEIPGLTQPYEQKVTLSEQITKLYIKPALLTGYIDLTSSKEAQIRITVVDNDTGKVYVQETRKVKLMSIYDFMLWDDEFGAYSDCDLLAWLTPESEGILALRRTAIAWLEDYTGGEVDSLPGYQLAFYGEEEYYWNTVVQVLGIQAAMSDMGMRYNMGSFSMTEGYNQRVLLPDACLNSGSGVCVETALIMASAIQSANMHAMLILPPGHAQVAIEDWDESGDYWLLETTQLPFDQYSDWDSFITYYDHDQWVSYLADPWGDGSGPCVVLDCDMATPLGLTGFSN